MLGHPASPGLAQRAPTMRRRRFGCQVRDYQILWRCFRSDARCGEIWPKKAETSLSEEALVCNGFVKVGTKSGRASHRPVKIPDFWANFAMSGCDGCLRFRKDSSQDTLLRCLLSVKPTGGLTFVAITLLLTAGCTKRHPRTATVVEPPQALAVPAPPPRVDSPAATGNAGTRRRRTAADQSDAPAAAQSRPGPQRTQTKPNVPKTEGDPGSRRPTVEPGPQPARRRRSRIQACSHAVPPAKPRSGSRSERSEAGFEYDVNYAEPPSADMKAQSARIRPTAFSSSREQNPGNTTCSSPRRSPEEEPDIAELLSRDAEGRTGMFVRLRGSRMRNVVPVPGVDCTSISPSCSCTVRYTIDRPMPLPSFVVK